jgi:cellulose biosynthesis protein BcsQ
MFNHKGGVGKTVDAYHIGWKLTEGDKRVLLVDGDSQVNLTALVFGPDGFDDYFDSEQTRGFNIKDGVAPVFEGKPASIKAFECPAARNNKNLFILPGHADLATYEGQLSLAQETAGSLSVLKNLPGALNALIGKTEELNKIDYTIIDLNPGLGAINQNFFLASDAFIVPTNPDPFSLLAIGTLGEYLVRWVKWKNEYGEKFSNTDYPLTSNIPKFLGTINARFNKHASKAAKKFDTRIKLIDAEVEKTLAPALSVAGMLFKDECYIEAFEKWKTLLAGEGQSRYALARIPDFQSLIHSATNSLKPVFAMTHKDLHKDGLQGTVLDRAEKNSKDFNDIFSAISDRIEILLNDKCGES